MDLSITKEIRLLARHSAVYSLGTFMQRIVALLVLVLYPLGLLGGRFFDPGEKEKIRMIIKNRSFAGVL